MKTNDFHAIVTAFKVFLQHSSFISFIFKMGGNSLSIEYAVPISEKKPGETPVLRHPQFKEGLFEGPTPDIKEMKSAFLYAFKKNENNEALGTIVRQ